MHAMLVVLLLAFAFPACEVVSQQAAPAATSGVRKATVEVKPQSNGLTVEQENIARRLQLENVPGSIKHLYVISAYSGQVLLYSTVKGKVTSSGKRLTPTTLAAQAGEYVSQEHAGVPIQIGGVTRRTAEVLQDDGTYGSSSEYLFWTDVQGRYHQHYPSGGQIIHVSDQPIVVKGVVLNLEMQTQ